MNILVTLHNYYVIDNSYIRVTKCRQLSNGREKDPQLQRFGKVTQLSGYSSRDRNGGEERRDTDTHNLFPLTDITWLRREKERKREVGGERSHIDRISSVSIAEEWTTWFDPSKRGGFQIQIIAGAVLAVTQVFPFSHSLTPPLAFHHIIKPTV